jgi:hypothetical protein
MIAFVGFLIIIFIIALMDAHDESNLRKRAMNDKDMQRYQKLYKSWNKKG